MRCRTLALTGGARSPVNAKGQELSRAAGAPPKSTSSQLGRRLRGLPRRRSLAGRLPPRPPAGRSTASDGTAGTSFGASESSSKAGPGRRSAPRRRRRPAAAEARPARRAPGCAAPGRGPAAPSGRSSAATSASRPARIGSRPGAGASGAGGRPWPPRLGSPRRAGQAVPAPARCAAPGRGSASAARRTGTAPCRRAA